MVVRLHAPYYRAMPELGSDANLARLASPRIFNQILYLCYQHYDSDTPAAPA